MIETFEIIWGALQNEFCIRDTNPLKQFFINDYAFFLSNIAQKMLYKICFCGDINNIQLVYSR